MTEESQDSKQQVTEKLYKPEKGTKLEAVKAFITSSLAPSGILPPTRLRHLTIPKLQRETSVRWQRTFLTQTTTTTNWFLLDLRPTLAIGRCSRPVLQTCSKACGWRSDMNQGEPTSFALPSGHVKMSPKYLCMYPNTSASSKKPSLCSDI